MKLIRDSENTEPNLEKPNMAIEEPRPAIVRNDSDEP